MMRITAVLALSLSALPACKREDAEKKDLQAICDAPNLEAVKRAASKPIDPALLNQLTAVEVEGKLTTKGGHAVLFVLTSQVQPLATRGRSLRKIAADNGVTSCAWADWLEDQAGPGPAAPSGGSHKYSPP